MIQGAHRAPRAEGSRNRSRNRVAPSLFNSSFPDVQADVKSLWTSYQQSLKESEGFLFGMGNPALIKAAIVGVNFGKKLPEDFYFHQSQEPALPPLLRLVVFAARQIVGDVERYPSCAIPTSTTFRIPS